jgi:small conductance mechanosensitive channel
LDRIGVKALAASTINIAVQPWVKVPDYVQATGELYQSIVELCREQRIELAFPQREIHILPAKTGESFQQ